MVTPLPITNESVARGYVRRTLREAPPRQQAALRKADAGFSPTRRRRGPLFRAWIGFMDTCLQERVLHREISGNGKHARGTWLYWEAAAEAERFRINGAILEARTLDLREVEMLGVTCHALQRLFQRLRTTDPSAALTELIPAAECAAQLRVKALRHGERYQVHLQIPTAHGDAVLVWDDDVKNFVVKTWIHRDSMNDPRAWRHDQALRCADLICV